MIGHPSIAGVNVVAETDYDAMTLLPVRYRVTRTGSTTEATFAAGQATPLQPPVTCTKLPGTTGRQ